MPRVAQWIYVDLSDTTSLVGIRLVWNNIYYASQYSIAISSDAKNWTFVHTEDQGTGGNVIIEPHVDCKYIGMYCKAKGEGPVYSLKEFMVYCDSSDWQVPYPGMIITEDTTFFPGEYTGFITGEGIEIGNSNITLDGNGAVLLGPGTFGDSSSFIGIGVLSDGNSDVTIKNLSARGFTLGLNVKNGNTIKILNNDFSDNYTDPDYGWGDGNPYGAIMLEYITNSEISGNVGDNVWNGLYLYYSDNNNIHDNHFSPCSNTSLKMWHSSNNMITDNNMSYGIRCAPGEVHARDSTSALIETSSNYNTFIHNDFSHGGDGVFIRPLNQNISTGNYFYNNDASYAHNNAWECWSPGNTFENNKANYSSYGFWLGGSDHTILINNEAAYNGTINANAPEGDFGHAGISVVKGSSSHFICSGNNIHDNNGVGIAVGYTIDYRAFHWVIQENTITDNTSHGIYLRDADWLDIAGNTITDNGGQ